MTAPAATAIDTPFAPTPAGARRPSDLSVSLSRASETIRRALRSLLARTTPARRARFGARPLALPPENFRVTRPPRAAPNARRESPDAPIRASAITNPVSRTLSRRFREKNFQQAGIVALRSARACIVAKKFLAARVRRPSRRELRQRENPCAMRIFA
jgi:hypothetical protein